MRKTSEKGLKFIADHEGFVSKAYKCPANVWTIGYGTTSNAGIKVTPGMRVTEPEARAMLESTLRKIFEPRTNKHMKNPSQNEFDAGVSFDYNTGAIHKASWVTSFNAGKILDAGKRILLWNKGGGRVLPGLVRRRKEEAAILVKGQYPGEVKSPRLEERPAPVASELQEVREVQQALADLGYEPGKVDGFFGKKTKAAIMAFQKDHDLVADGIAGKATRSTLQRVLDSRQKLKTVAVTGTSLTGAATTLAVTVADHADIPWDMVVMGGVGLSAVAACCVAFKYRDVLKKR